MSISYGRFIQGLAIVLAVVIVTSCYYDVEEELYPNGCSTENITFDGTIMPILELQCLTCHNALSVNGGVNLEGYDNVKRVIDNGRLMGAIRHEPGFASMPQNGPMLSQCTIDKFQAWIDQGAPNN